ncbi:MAG TPA: hypothetical protein VGB08_04000 [Allosphingosinicella sp.]|jgi:hypothetical protein
MQSALFIAEELLWLWPFILVPAALLLLVRPVGRLAFFVLGLIFFAGIGSVMTLGGPDSPGLIIPFFGLCLSLAAAIAEAVVRIARAARRLRERRRPAG